MNEAQIREQIARFEEILACESSLSSHEAQTIEHINCILHEDLVLRGGDHQRLFDYAHDKDDNVVAAIYLDSYEVKALAFLRNDVADKLLARAVEDLETRRADWDESEHPRDERGRWTESGGGESGGTPPSADAEAERERKAAHVRLVLHTGRAVARELGYDPDMVSIGASESREAKFVLNDTERRAAGLAYTRGPNKGRIKLFPEQMPEYELAKGVAAHEVQHIKFQYALERHRAEYEAVIREPKAEGGTDPVMYADGRLKPPYDEKYPAYQAIEQAMWIAGMDKLALSDGVSQYSYDWWKEQRANKANYEQAIHETLAEMARIKYETGKFPTHMGETIISWRGEDKPKPTQAERDAGAKRWRDLYRAVDKIWESRSKSKAADDLIERKVDYIQDPKSGVKGDPDIGHLSEPVAFRARNDYIERGRDGFDPSQPRDDHGRWTDTGAGEGSGGGNAEADAARATATEGSPRQLSGAFRAKSPGDAESRRHVAKVWELGPQDVSNAKALGVTPQTFHELTGEGAARFHAAISAAKGATPYGASVHAYPVDDYRSMRVFLTEDGKSGFALKGDDIVSAFKHPDTGGKRYVDAALALATQNGGRRLDAFDTVLPTLYGKAGFRTVARTKWVDEFAPDGWDYKTYQEFNGGRPDIVFMVYDPADAAPYKRGDGVEVPTYDDGTAAQIKALKSSAQQRAWNEADHPRDPAGSPTGGQFTGDGAGRESASKPSKGKTTVDVRNLTIQDDFTFTQGNTDQDVKSLDELYERSKAEEAGFKAGIDQLAADTGGTAIYTPPEFSEPGTTLKSRKSAERKMNTEENGDPTKLRDILRATVQHETVQESRGAALRFIQEQGDNIVRVKDRIVTPLQGYRDILINFRTEGGVISEVQFSADDMLKAKFGEGHKLYEQLRELQVQANVDPQMIIVLQQQSVAIYDEAYQRDGNGNWGKRQ